MKLIFLPLNIGMVLHFEFHSSRSQIFFSYERKPMTDTIETQIPELRMPLSVYLAVP